MDSDIANSGLIRPTILPSSVSVSPGGKSPSPLEIKYFKTCPAVVSVSVTLI